MPNTAMAAAAAPPPMMAVCPRLVGSVGLAEMDRRRASPMFAAAALGVVRRGRSAAGDVTPPVRHAPRLGPAGSPS